ncbi:MAG TPA: disulfide bond formation protein B [Caulobacter sp.]|nr:disulfide bond formation protein B [Caulobacter sp.]
MTALKRLILFVLKHWPETALLSSALMLAAAHGFERIANLLPCTLCLKQREVYWAAIAIALVAIVIKRTRHARRVSPWLDGLLGLVFLFGVGLAFYHAGVEWKWWPGPETCAGGGAGVSMSEMERLVNGGKTASPACDKALWHFLGLSMAGWNVIVSLKLAGWSFVSAYNRLRP